MHSQKQFCFLLAFISNVEQNMLWLTCLDYSFSSYISVSHHYNALVFLHLRLLHKINE